MASEGRRTLAKHVELEARRDACLAVVVKSLVGVLVVEYR
jgi:hypothetical protein